MVHPRSFALIGSEAYFSITISEGALVKDNLRKLRYIAHSNS